MAGRRTTKKQEPQVTEETAAEASETAATEQESATPTPTTKRTTKKPASDDSNTANVSNLDSTFKELQGIAKKELSHEVNQKLLAYLERANSEVSAILSLAKELETWEAEKQAALAEITDCLNYVEAHAELAERGWLDPGAKRNTTEEVQLFATKFNRILVLSAQIKAKAKALGTIANGSDSKELFGDDLDGRIEAAKKVAVTGVMTLSKLMLDGLEGLYRETSDRPYSFDRLYHVLSKVQSTH